jgi:CRISPR-associated protein Cmr3
MTELFIRPLDVLLFRDGKPFSSGEDHVARSIFPPLPTVMQGVIRGRYLAYKNVNLADRAAIADCVGTPTEYGSLRLRGPFIRKADVLYVPMPLDTYCAAESTDGKEGMDGRYRMANVLVRDGYQVSNTSRLPYMLAPPGSATPTKHTPGYVSIANLKRHLARNEDLRSISQETFVVFENRYGNGISAQTKSVTRGALYQVRYARLQEDVGLHIDVEAHWDDWQEQSGVLSIGGEARAAHFKVSAASADCSLHDDMSTLGERFKLVLLTPTYFDEGWQPRAGNWSHLFESTDGSQINVMLKAAAIGRYQSVGGFDLAERTHKPARRYVPAGSVYYFVTDRPARLKHGWLCDALPGNVLGQIGFGQVLAGSWSPAA